MLGSVVQQVAPLAERLDVAVPTAAVARFVVEMRRRQPHLGRPARLFLGPGRAGDLAAETVSPAALTVLALGSSWQDYPAGRLGLAAPSANGTLRLLDSFRESWVFLLDQAETQRPELLQHDRE